QPVIQLHDGSNNPVSQSGVPIKAAIATGGGTLLGTLMVNTDASGQATFTNLAISGTVGPRTIQFTSLELTPVTSGIITVSTGPAQTIAANSATSQAATVATAVAAPPSVLVTDVGGNPVSGVNVTFTVTAGGGTLSPASPATVATGVNGVATLTSWTLGTTAGTNNNSVTAAAAVANGSPVTFTATATAGAASTIGANSVTSQSAPISTAVAAPPSVLVTDALGNPKSGVDVTFTVTAGGGSTSPASPATVATGVNGVASLSGWTLGSAVGTDNNAITAVATVPNGSPVTFTASGTALPPTTIAAVSATAQSATVNTAVGAPPSVKVTDANGVPVAAVNVTFTVTGGGGSISPASPATIATDAGGIATLSDWTVGTTAGVFNNTVSASAAVPNGNPVVFTATATAGAASSIAANSAVTQSATPGSDVTAPSVIVTDAFGNPVAGVDVTFTLTADGSGGSIAPVSPAVVTTNSSGIASLATWTLGADVGTDNNAVDATAAVPNGSPVTFTASGTAESGARAAGTLSQLLLRW
ncbi:MAG TPA: hypothetical protein VJU15_05925, partial [Gemmatimonadales bacterium]|nr:hypothetical protein [Gemmatimonadales bacterium]